MTLFDERPIRPMMAKTGEAFDSDDFIFELKWDGLRALLFKSNNQIQLQNRNLRDVTADYPELKQLGRSIKAKTVIIDGEVVILNSKGVPDFGKMQNRFGINDPNQAEVLGKTIPVTYVAFDILHLNGKDLTILPLVERKRILKKSLQEGPHLIFGDHVQEAGTRFYKEATLKGFEGIIAKKKDSHYSPGIRAEAWIKVKGVKTIDCIVVGYTGGEGQRSSSFGALIVAAYDRKGRLIHIGNVGGGFNSQDLERITPMIRGLVRKTPVLEGTVEAPSPITWVRPSVVIEAKYSSMTHENKLRFPRFSRLRPDKPPLECHIDL